MTNSLLSPLSSSSYVCLVVVADDVDAIVFIYKRSLFPTFPATIPRFPPFVVAWPLIRSVAVITAGDPANADEYGILAILAE